MKLNCQNGFKLTKTKKSEILLSMPYVLVIFKGR